MLDVETPFAGWPSGDNRGVLYLTLSMRDVEERYGIKQWKRGWDEQLQTYFNVSYFNDETLGPVIFEKYEHRVNQEMDVLIDRGLDVDRSIERLKDVLELKDEDIAAVMDASRHLDLQEEESSLFDLLAVNFHVAGLRLTRSLWLPGSK